MDEPMGQGTSWLYKERQVHSLIRLRKQLGLALNVEIRNPFLPRSWLLLFLQAYTTSTETSSIHSHRLLPGYDQDFCHWPISIPPTSSLSDHHVPGSPAHLFLGSMNTEGTLAAGSRILSICICALRYTRCRSLVSPEDRSSTTGNS